MRMIDAAAVDALLDYPGLIDALEAGHRAGVDTAERLVLAQPGAVGLTRHLLVWPAWQGDEALGVKLVTSFSRQRRRRLSDGSGDLRPVRRPQWRG